MDVRAPTFSILLVSLLSLSTTKSVAHNHFLIPSSCIGHPSLLKCALDFEFALKAAASTKIQFAASALNVALDSINSAKAAGLSILHFVSSIHGGLINEHPKIEWINKLNSTIGIAVHELVKAYTVIHSEKKLSLAELYNCEKSLKIASEIATKLSVGAGLNHENSDANVLLGSLINQFINLIKLSLKVIGTIEAKGKISLGGKSIMASLK